MAINHIWGKYATIKTPYIKYYHFADSGWSGDWKEGAYDSSRYNDSQNLFQYEGNANYGWYAYKSYTVDTSTGTVTFSDKMSSHTYEEVLNYINISTDNRVYMVSAPQYSNKTTFSVPDSYDIVYTPSYTIPYVFTFRKYNEYDMYCFSCSIGATIDYNYSKGSYIGDVTSTSSTFYPKDSYKYDSSDREYYWYVYVGDDNVAPTIPGVPMFASEIKGGDVLSISWTESTDINDNLSGYQLQVSRNGGSWSQIYKGKALSYNYTIPSGTTSVAFRVRAYDALSANSSYATSGTYAVINFFESYCYVDASFNNMFESGYAYIDGEWLQLTGEGYIYVDGSWVTM